MSTVYHLAPNGFSLTEETMEDFTSPEMKKVCMVAIGFDAIVQFLDDNSGWERLHHQNVNVRDFSTYSKQARKIKDGSQEMQEIIGRVEKVHRATRDGNGMHACSKDECLRFFQLLKEYDKACFLHVDGNEDEYMQDRVYNGIVKGGMVTDRNSLHRLMAAPFGTIKEQQFEVGEGDMSDKAISTLTFVALMGAAYTVPDEKAAVSI